MRFGKSQVQENEGLNVQSLHQLKINKKIAEPVTHLQTALFSTPWAFLQISNEAPKPCINAND